VRLIIDWGESQIIGLHKYGLARIVAEVGDDGFVVRELGYDMEGRLVHRCPSEGCYGARGIFDSAPIAVPFATAMPPEEFERLWSR
jgi:hypothetical protein